MTDFPGLAGRAAARFPVYNRPRFGHVPVVTTKTITLELDAYEKLRAAQKPGESLSEVIRRADLTKPLLDDPLTRKAPTGAQLLEYYRNGGGGFSEEDLDSIEEALKYDDALKDKPLGNALTGEALLAYIHRGGGGFTEEELDSIEEALKYNPLPDDPWA